MPKVNDSIEVQVPVQQAYNQWTQFEEFPKFMDGIQSVLQLDDTHVQWVAEIRGQKREWTTEIIDQQPDEKISWKTISGEVKNDGTVTFEKVGDDTTRINVEMDVQSESATENVAGDLLGIVKTQVHGDLERFKQLIENRDEATAPTAVRWKTARPGRYCLSCGSVRSGSIEPAARSQLESVGRGVVDPMRSSKTSPAPPARSKALASAR